MAREMSDKDHEALADSLHEHVQQVLAGAIPADSPLDFVKPDEEDSLDEHGRPWWFGPDFKPTEAAMKEFSQPE